jgi:hypothetical protein
MTVFIQKRAGDPGGSMNSCQPEVEGEGASLRDIPELVVAAGAVVLAATLFCWMLFSF